MDTDSLNASFAPLGAWRWAVTSKLQRDIERIEPLIPFDPETREAWQRIRARLTPGRERVVEAIKHEAAGWATYLSDFEAHQIADAVIAAMGEP